MMKYLFILIFTGTISFIFTDMESSSSFYSVVLPVVNVIILILMAAWFAVLLHKLGKKQCNTSHGSDVGGFGGFGGGDGGI